MFVSPCSKHKVAKAILTSPTPNVGTVLGTSNIRFQWSAGNGPTQYALKLGASQGAGNLYSSAGLTGTQVTVPSLPALGATVYGRLFSNINGAWGWNDSTYVAPFVCNGAGQLKGLD